MKEVFLSYNDDENLFGGALQRKILIPPGKWKKPDDSYAEGPDVLLEHVTMDSLFNFIGEDQK